MNVKEYLSRYHQTKVKIEELEQIVAEYIRLANSIPGINFDQVRIDGTKSLQAPFEKWILRALNDEAEIEELKRTLPIIKGEIICSIDLLENKELRRMLILRYIDNYNWMEISELMYVSLSTIKRWHKHAINLLKNDKCIV